MANSALWRIPFVVGSTARLAYGLGSVLAPEGMSGRFAPRLHGKPDPRMNLRGFGGAQSAIAVYTLLRTRTAADAAGVLQLNALVDGFDTAVSLLERRDRGRTDRIVAGGVAVNVAGLTCWTIAALLLRADRRQCSSS